MLCVEDQLDALKWAEALGGLPALVARTEENLKIVADWVAATPWVDFLAEDPVTRSSTSICLKIVDPWFTGLPAAGREDLARAVAATLEREAVALDAGSYRDAPPGLRLWCGATIEAADLKALLPWLDWAYADAKSRHQKAA
jgi:phosphoserine aminotransferase